MQFLASSLSLELSLEAAACMAAGAASAGVALSAPVLTRTSGATTYPPTVDFTRPIDWVDVPTMYGVMQRSQDQTFATGVSEGGPLQITAAVTTYDFDLDTIASGNWYIRMAAYSGSRPGVLNWSNTAAVGDVIAPLLTLPTDAATADTTATITVTTDDATGTLYWFVSTSATPPSASALKAGTGSAAFGNSAIASSGLKSFNVTGLTAATQYYSYFLHSDSYSNDSSISSADGFVTTGGYSAVGVRFDGGDRLARGAALTGVSASKVGILSFWFFMKGSDAVQQLFLGINQGAGFTVTRETTNKIRVRGLDTSGGSLYLRLQTNSTYTTSMTGWAHLLASWDLAAGTAEMYISDAANSDAAQKTTVNTAIGYNTTNYGVGGSTGGLTMLDGELAEVYLNTAEFLDITNSANRRKFISGSGHPVDLGATGSTPTGTAPAIFLANPLASWHTNKGTGGGFTLTGALAASGTTP